MNKKPQYNFFMKVPNNQYGRDIIALIRHFINKESYRIRLRGTGLDRMKAPEGYKQYDGHVSLRYAKEIRIYIHAKVPIGMTKDQVVGIDTVKRLTETFFKQSERYEYENRDVVGTSPWLANHQ